MPARTQFLTSAACCLCPHPIFVAPLSPIPKLASAAAACQSTSVTGKPAYPADTRAPNFVLNDRPMAAWPSRGCDHLCPLTLYQDALCVVFAQTAENPEWAEKTRNVYRSASRLGLRVGG